MVLHKSRQNSNSKINRFIAALVTIAKTRRQSKCPSTDEWIKCGAYIQWGYHLAIKKNKIMPFATTWMGLEIIILSKAIKRKTIPCDITYMQNLKYDTNEPFYKTETDAQT